MTELNQNVLKIALDITPSETKTNFGVLLLRLKDNVLIQSADLPLFKFWASNTYYSKYLSIYKKITDNGIVNCDSQGNILK